MNQPANNFKNDFDKYVYDAKQKLNNNANKFNNYAYDAKQMLNNNANKFNNYAYDAKQMLNNNVNKFNSSKYVDGTKQFLNSNDSVAKIAFLLLIVICFVTLLRLSITFVTWLINFKNTNPTLINGMIDSKQMIVIPQNPSIQGSIPVLRSTNKQGGIEFTYTVWIYIDDFEYKRGQYRHIFHKGNDDINSKGLNFPNNAPGLYITPNQNNLAVIMNTFNDISEEILIKNIPIKKWVNVIIKCQEEYLDVFINGNLSKRHNFKNEVPKQNYGDIYVSMNGGFDGYTSNLKYYNYAISTSEVQKIVSNGPNITILNKDDGKTSSTAYDYLSLNWFTKM